MLRLIYRDVVMPSNLYSRRLFAFNESVRWKFCVCIYRNAKDKKILKFKRFKQKKTCFFEIILFLKISWPSSAILILRIYKKDLLSF